MCISVSYDSTCVLFIAHISCFFPRCQSWADYLSDFKFSLWLSFCSFSVSVVHNSGSGTLEVSVSQKVLALCPGCHVWPIFYSGDPFQFSSFLVPTFPLTEEFPFLLSWELWSWTGPVWLGISSLHALSSHKQGTCPWTSVSLRQRLPQDFHCPFVLTGLLSEPISLHASRWQCLPPSALRLD